MFRTPALRRFSYFTQPNWPGGIYATPTILGSRNGSVIAGCWAAMMFTGRSGYVQAARAIVAKQKQMIQAVKSLPGLKVIGDPQGSVFAFIATEFDIYRVSELMGKRGWSLSPCQYPPAIHMTVVLNTNADQFAIDLKEVHAVRCTGFTRYD